MFSFLLVVALAAMSISAPFPAVLECSEGWTLIDRTCFLLTDASGTWDAGQSFCNQRGASLATISSQTQQDAITTMLSQSVWIGLNDLKEDHSYGWADGSEYNYASWDDDQPNNSGDVLWVFGNREDCVEMRQKVDYMWHDEHCYEARQFLCSMAPEKITTTTTVTTKPAPVCEEGWETFEEAICYKASNAVASWPEARDACLTQGAQLAAITSEGQQNFLAARLIDNTWIGLTDEMEEGTFTWQDGTEPEYTNWKKGEPNNSYAYLTFGVGEDCVEVRPGDGDTWNDLLCTARRQFVCQKPPQ